MKTLNSYVCTSNGREYRFQVIALSEDRELTRYIGETSPIDCYALVDILNNEIISTIEDVSLREAENTLLEDYEYEE